MNPKSRRPNLKMRLARDIARITKSSLTRLHLETIVDVLLSVAAGYGVQSEQYNCEIFSRVAHDVFHVAEERLIRIQEDELHEPKKEPGLAN